MRRVLTAAVVTSFATLMLGGLATPASAVCGGGEPNGPCQCPELKIVKIYC